MEATKQFDQTGGDCCGEFRNEKTPFVLIFEAAAVTYSRIQASQQPYENNTPYRR